jgi:hypothetical protein
MTMWQQLPCEALQKGKLLQLRYDGFFRVVEVHAVGNTKEGNLVMRVWQVRGGSVSGESQGWKLLRLDEAIGGQLIDENSQAPRHGYRRNDSVMITISCQL